MTKSKVFEILDSVIIENDFWLSEMDECREKNFDLMENITSIFKMEKARDFTLLMASIKLLCKDPVPVINYFREENMREIQFEEPVRNDLLIIATVFQTNPVFFSMCWNFVAMIENELAVKNEYSSESEDSNLNLESETYVYTIIIFRRPGDWLYPQSVEADYSIKLSSAGTPGFNNLTKMPINFPFLGELEVRGNSETKRLVFVLFIAPECRERKFKLNIYYEIDNKEYTATIIKESPESTDEIRSLPIHIDFSKGIHIKKVEWNPL